MLCVDVAEDVRMVHLRRRPNPPCLQTAISRCRSEAFMGLSHADRLALVFTSLYDGLEAASSPCPTPRSSAVFPAGASRTTVLERAEGKSRGDAAAVSLSQSCSPRGVSRCYGKGKPRAGGERRGKPGEESQQNERPQSDRNPVSVDTVGAGSEEGGQNKNRRVLRGRVKASYVGSNVEALPVWGGLDTIAGCSLLVECRTPAQWRAGEFQPSGQVSFRYILVRTMPPVLSKRVCTHLSKGAAFSPAI